MYSCFITSSGNLIVAHSQTVIHPFCYTNLVKDCFNHHIWCGTKKNEKTEISLFVKRFKTKRKKI